MGYVIRFLFKSDRINIFDVIELNYIIDSEKSKCFISAKN